MHYEIILQFVALMCMFTKFVVLLLYVSSCLWAYVFTCIILNFYFYTAHFKNFTKLGCMSASTSHVSADEFVYVSRYLSDCLSCYGTCVSYTALH